MSLGQACYARWGAGTTPLAKKGVSIMSTLPEKGGIYGMCSMTSDLFQCEHRKN